MNVAQILRESGLVPIVPCPQEGLGTPRTLVTSHIPIVPIVPTEKNSGEAQAIARVLSKTEVVHLHGVLLKLADALGVDPVHVRRLENDGLTLLAALTLDGLRGYLLAARDSETRLAGRVPTDDTAGIFCLRCGPVFVHPDIAECLPVVDGWPRALGCPWCFVRSAGGYIPRPIATCEGCAPQP